MCLFGHTDAMYGECRQELFRNKTLQFTKGGISTLLQCSSYYLPTRCSESWGWYHIPGMAVSFLIKVQMFELERNPTKDRYLARVDITVQSPEDTRDSTSDQVGPIIKTQRRLH
jgi:hypothetical protein